jgi:hypothetical protein
MNTGEGINGSGWADLLAESGAGLATEWRACLEALKGDTSPLDVGTPEDWSTEDATAIESLRGMQFAMLEDTLRDAEQPRFARAFGAWRRHVMDIESANAARLALLLWMLRTAERVAASDPTMHDDCAHFRQQVRAILAERWCIGYDESLPADTIAARDWSARRAREFELLPRPWRQVGRW